MKRYFLLFLFFPTILCAQFVEDWNRADFQEVPMWDGNTELFSINSSLFQIDLTAPAEAGEAYLYTACEAIDNAYWEFSVQMDFNPSSANYAVVYICASDLVVDEDLEGYFVKIGDTADDVSLWKRINGVDVKIIDGTDKLLDTSLVNVSVRVERDDAGNWLLYSKTEEDEYALEGAVFDNDLVRSNYFILGCVYTSSRSALFHYGAIEVEGDPFVDEEPPRLLSHQVLNGQLFQLVFDEVPDVSTISGDHFTFLSDDVIIESVNFEDEKVDLLLEDYMSDIGNGQLEIKDIADAAGNFIHDTIIYYSYNRLHISQHKVLSDRELLLQFSKPIDFDLFSLDGLSGLSFESYSWSNDSLVVLQSLSVFEPGEVYSLTVSGVSDWLGDQLKDTTIDVVYYKAQRFDVVISEFMSDPSPEVGLPEVEYIELFNTTDHVIDLGGFYLSVNGDASVVPDYELAAQSYVLVTDLSDVDLWDPQLPVLGFNSLPSLTNSSGELVLYNLNGQVCDAVFYPLGVDDDTFKSDGGWSLERIDCSNFELSNGNWDYTVDLDGGTPGRENSLKQENPDYNAPVIKYIRYISKSACELVFSEAMDTIGWFENAPLDHASLKIKANDIDSTLLDRVGLYFETACDTGVVYLATLNEQLSDYAGNELFNEFQWRIGIPQSIDSFDVCINEVLFNPAEGGVDFVEIYNRSEKIINLSQLYVASMADMVPIKLYQVNEFNQLLFPGEYCVIAEDTAVLMNAYENAISQLLCESSLPSLNDDEGNIAVVRENGDVLDYFEYTDDMHYELLQEDEGVSLERLSPNMPTNNINNWHSASSASGYATPTLVNSQYTDFSDDQKEKWMWLETESFSPNGDGDNDYMQINYQLRESGWSGSVVVYDSRGRLINALANNDLLGTSGFFKWDGSTDNNNKAAVGIYIVYAEFFSSSGEVKKEKLVCVLSAGRKK
jgi:hypothetical protein